MVLVFPSGSVVKKNLPANAGDARDVGSIPGLWRSRGEGNGHPLQYSCLENSMDRGAWWAAVHGVPKSWTQLSDWEHAHAPIGPSTIGWKDNFFSLNFFCHLAWRILVPWPGMEPVPSAAEAWSLNQWMPGKLPEKRILYLLSCFSIIIKN